jgi:hypothetical protein
MARRQADYALHGNGVEVKQMERRDTAKRSTMMFV